MDPGLPSLFIGSLLASTLVPGGVEVLLYFLYQSGQYSLSSLLWVATSGNTLGGIITFAMGVILNRGLARFDWHRRVQRFFRLDDNALARVRKWGVPVLFFSWMPIVGDPLCLAAGFLRLSVWPSIAMIFISKLSRYAVLLWLFPEP
jgi:membrane protein YqaA with SNARE-associated domain